MINESKQAIKQVFDNFDKDKSGFVDQNELIALSKELGQEMTQEELKKLMNSVDINKDGKIAFQEFWEWWQYGKNGKLEKLVFLKLKAMNLIKKVHSEFTRFGGSLAQKYEGDGKDQHYFAFNFGETLGHIRMKMNFFLQGKGVQEEIKQVPYGGFEDENTLQILIVTRCQNPEQAKQDLENFLALLETTALNQNARSQEAVAPFLLFLSIMGGSTVFVTGKDELAIKIKISHPLIIETLNYSFLPFMEQLGPNNYIHGDLNMGIKNGFKKLIAKGLPFVKFMAEGFLLEVQTISNTSLMKNVFKTIQNFLSFQGGEDPSAVQLNAFLALALLLKSSKTHITFKTMQDLEMFFKALGLSELSDGQPSGRDILREALTSSEVETMKNGPISSDNFIYQFCKIFMKYGWAQGNIYVTIPYFMLSSQFSFEGLYEFFLCLFQEEPEEKKK